MGYRHRRVDRAKVARLARQTTLDEAIAENVKVLYRLLSDRKRLEEGPMKNRVAEFREAAGMKQPELAARVGLRAETLSRIENGASTKLTTMRRISDVFERSVSEVFFVDTIEATA